MVNFLDGIGMRGFLTLIGLRTTSGSSVTLPPKKNVLLACFNKKFVKVRILFSNKHLLLFKILIKIIRKKLIKQRRKMRLKLKTTNKKTQVKQKTET